MIDSLKNTLLAGLGAASYTKEKVEDIFKDLVEKGKVSKEEAENYLSRLSTDAREQFDKTSREACEKLQDLLRKGPFATVSDLKKLEERIEALENRRQE
jgi:polyhydroxyalkanoate synthesis regulator phasin